MNPNTTALEKPCIRSENSNISIARRQNSTALSCSEKTEETHPPSRPTNTIMAVSNGTIARLASTRGVTSLRLGSVPIARIASTCSVTSMEPSSEAIPDEQRPAVSRPVIAGASSRTSARHHVSGQRCLPKTHELRAGLQHHDPADEEPGEQNNRHRANAHVIHLHERVLKIMRGRREIAERA